MNNTEYAGFWVRVGASLIDTVLMMIIVFPVLTFIYGSEYWVSDSFFVGVWDFVFNMILPAIAVILFWVYRAATPSKMAFRLKIVDADTGEKVSTGRLIGRYFGYYVATIPLFLGLIWVGIDRRKQGWHDKLAGTVVIRSTQKEPVLFDRGVWQAFPEASVLAFQYPRSSDDGFRTGESRQYGGVCQWQGCLRQGVRMSSAKLYSRHQELIGEHSLSSLSLIVIKSRAVCTCNSLLMRKVNSIWLVSQYRQSTKDCIPRINFWESGFRKVLSGVALYFWQQIAGL